MSDRDIIRLLKRRPSEGLREAMKKYYAPVQVVVGRILPRNPQDAEECVEDAFVNIWKSIARIDENTDTFRGYLLGAARNIAITRYRQLRRNSALSLELAEIADTQDIIDEVESADATRALQALIVEMEEPDKGIFFRRHFLAEPVRQIAQALGLDEVQVKNRLYRGKLRLRKQLEERGISHEAI